MDTEAVSPEYVKAERDRERTEELRVFVVTSAKYQGIPIFLALWAMDFLYAPQLVWKCLAIRLFCIPLNLLIIFLFRRPRSLNVTQILVIGFLLGNSLLVVALITITEGMSSPYYAGLNFITFAIVCFPWTWRFVVSSLAAIYVPFFVAVFLKGGTLAQYRVLSIHSFFIVGTILICQVIRIYMEKLRTRELLARLQLKNEVLSRDRVIRVKTDESVRLRLLGSQFSPQVTEGIISGRIKLEESVRKYEICAINVDIVGSTAGLQRIPPDDFQRIISDFMNDTGKIILKFDVTIDKYIGDGVLAFSNTPVPYSNYVERAVNAALEIQEMFENKQLEYQSYWKRAFELRIGIASGSAYVGLYGTKETVMTYTAIGEPINLACRLCGGAEPGTVLVDSSVVSQLREGFDVAPVPQQTFKGFEDRVFKLFTLSRKGIQKVRAA